MASQTTQQASSVARNGGAPPKSPDNSGAIGEAASEAFAAASNVAQQATEGAKQTAVHAVNMVSGQLRELLDHQVVTGADIIGHVASSVQVAADDLDQNVPQVSKLVRGIADRMEAVAEDMRDQTAEELMQSAVDFTRRQPALTFGLAALAGFFVFRALKSGAPGHTSSPTVQSENGPRSRNRTSHDA